MDEAKAVQKVHCDGHDLVDDLITNTIAEVAQIILARNGVMEAGELPVGTDLVAIVQIATALGVINILIHFGGHFEHDETGRVVAASASGAIRRRTQGAGEVAVQGRADEPTEATVDIALRGQRNGMGRACIASNPAAGGFGKRGGEDVAVLLIEGLGMGDKSVEIKGRELVAGKRENVSAHSSLSYKKRVVTDPAMMPHAG